MKSKKKEGYVGIDMAIAIVSVIVFSGLIFSLMYYNALENIKLRKQALATIYLTETMENIAIEDYENITQENIQNGRVSLIPADMDTQKYSMAIEVNALTLSPEIEDEDIVKKVKATVTYTVQDKTYQYSMERTKVKE